ncbi:MerR family transcriptional regulator [Nocardia tengchongensis]
MFIIGDFARHGRVSVRMLRHYDATGLLHPARVDPASGYRYYNADQLTRLNRIIALKDLGFTLQQVREILDEKVTIAELRAMLRVRQAELEAVTRATASRLVRVEARLHSIESEGQMPDNEVVVKSLPSVRIAEMTGVATDIDSVGLVIEPLYDELFRRLETVGIRPSGPGIAHYDDSPDGGIVVHAGIEVCAPLRDDDGLRIVDLPAIEQAATIVHRGSMAASLPTFQALGRWIDANGYRSVGYPREINLECPANLDDWVTEFQEPIADPQSIR